MNESNLFEPINELGQPGRSALAPDPYAEVALPERAGVGGTLEALLKRPGMVLHALRQGRGGRAVWALALAAFGCLAVYGAVAGSLSGGSQLWLAPLKVVAGSLGAAAICLPSLYVFLCLSGVDTRWRVTVGALAAMVALSSLLLIGLAPVAWVFSQSTESVALMATMHLVFWAAAAGLGARLLGRFLGEGGRQARIGVWLTIYLVVCLQMMTALRPIIGKADTALPAEKRFFVQHFFEMLEGDARVDTRVERGR